MFHKFIQFFFFYQIFLGRSLLISLHEWQWENFFFINLEFFRNVFFFGLWKITSLDSSVKIQTQNSSIFFNLEISFEFTFRVFISFFFARLRSGTFVFCDATQSNVTCNLTNRWVRTQTRRVHDWRVDVSLLAANADCFISWTPFFLLFVVCRQQWCAHRYCCALEWDTTNNWSMYVANVCAYAHENEFDCVSFLRFVVCL